MAVLQELDVHAALHAAQALIRCVTQARHGCEGEEEEDDWEDVSWDARSANVVDVCVRQLKESMLWLRDDMTAHELSMKAHNQKWFSRWRHSDCAVHVDAIYRHKRIFDARLRMLLDIVAARPVSLLTPPTTASPATTAEEMRSHQDPSTVPGCARDARSGVGNK